MEILRDITGYFIIQHHTDQKLQILSSSIVPQRVGVVEKKDGDF
jgi:hypothetical protein